MAPNSLQYSHNGAVRTVLSHQSAAAMRRLLLKQVGLEMTPEGAQSRIWCSEIGWQTVPCLWSIDGEAALTGSSPGVRDQQSPRRRGTQLLATMHGVSRHTQVSQVARGFIV